MKRYLYIIILCIQFALGSTTIVAQNTTTNEVKSRIDTYLSKSVSNGYSASVLVAKNGEIILSKGYGWSDRQKKIVNSSTTVFNIGSVTKQFTAAAILKLVEQGKLNLSDKLSTFYKEVPTDKKDITIHQLLTHTSGVSVRTGGFRYDEASKDRFLKAFFEAELETKPGTRHQYANANYILLADIIEKTSKKDYTSFLKATFWEPLKMDHTGYKSISFDSEKLAHGFYFNYTEGTWKDWGTTQEQLPYNNNHWYSIGKGDIHSTVEDLFTWHKALQNNLVLSAMSKELLETPYVAENETGSSHYAYGWATFKTKSGKKAVWHNGSNGIYFATFLRFTEDDIVIIVLSNTILNSDSENVAWEIEKMISDPNYTPNPITKFSYELVYDFMNSNTPDKSELLPDFLNKNLNSTFSDKAVFNRIGFKCIAKEKEPAWGLELLKLNVQLFPTDGNLWDSLGDGYFTYNLKEKAINAFKKALELKSESNCYWCKNSQDKLELLKQ